MAAFRHLRTWCRALVKTLKAECAKTLPETNSGLKSAWSAVRNRLARNMFLATHYRHPSCLSFVDGRRRCGLARLPVPSRYYPKMLLDTYRRHSSFPPNTNTTTTSSSGCCSGSHRAILMPTNNVWTGIGLRRCYTTGNRVPMISRERVKVKNRELKSIIQSPAKLRKTLPKIRAIQLKPSFVPRPKLKAPILSQNLSEEGNTPGLGGTSPPDKREDAKTSTARTWGKQTSVFRNWQFNQAYVKPKQRWARKRWTDTPNRYKAPSKFTFKPQEFSKYTPIKKPPPMQRKSKRTAAAKAPEPKSEQDNIKWLLGDLLSKKPPTIKERSRDIEYGNKSPTFKIMSHGVERRSNLHNQQFVKQLENPILFTHPLIRNQSLQPVQMRRTISMAPKLTKQQEMRHKEQLHQRLNMLLAASEIDEDERDDVD